MPSSLLRPLARRTAAGLGASVLALSAAGLAAPALAAESGDTVTLLNINDFHGRISSTAQPLACTVTTERAAAENSVLLSAGDNVGASEFASYIDDDKPTIDYLNALGLAASSTGNHEYDQGYEDLRDRIEPRADWPYLAANVTADGEPTSDPYAIVDAGDVKVAVVGAVTQETPGLTSPAGLEGVEFHDPVDSVNSAIDELTSSGEEYDVLAVEYHDGSSTSAEAGAAPEMTDVFTKIVEGTSAEADVVFTSHTHQTYLYDAPVPGQEGETRPIVQTGSYGDNLGKVTLQRDDAGDWDVVPEDTALVPTADADLDACADDPVYTAAADIAERAAAEGEEAAKQPVGSIATDITTAFGPDGAEYVDGVWTQKDGYDGRGDDRASSSALSDELADSMVWATQRDSYAGARATIGVMNPGGVRANLMYAGGDGGDGVVTYGEANDPVPFVNNLSTIDLTGEQFTTLLEQQWQRDENGDIPSRPYLQLGLSGNVDYTFDASREEGDRITSVTIDGEPLDPSATYTVVGASFLVAGGDNFHAFAEGSNEADTGLLDRDAWIDYLAEHENLAADYSQRGVEVRSEDGADAATVTVSGLESRSLGAPQIETATLTIDGTEYSAPYEQAEDGSWSAAISLPLPSGEYTATLTADPDTGTAVTVPLTLETEVPTSDDSETPAPGEGGEGSDDGSDGGAGDGSGEGPEDGVPAPGDGEQGSDDEAPAPSDGGSGSGDAGDDEGSSPQPEDPATGGGSGSTGGEGTSSAGSGGDLARTGAQIAGPIAAAAALLAAGGTLLISRRRSAVAARISED